MNSIASSQTPQEQITEFIAAIFDAEDIVELRLLPSGKQSWHRAGDVPNECARLQDENGRGENIYFGANPRKREGGSTSDDVEVFRCVFVDVDHVSLAEAHQSLAKSGLPDPTALVFSGHGVHAYWRLVEPITDAAKWRGHQKALIAAVKNADPAIHDPARLMRLPGFLNAKRKPEVKAALMKCDPSLRYPVSAFPNPRSEDRVATGAPADCRRVKSDGSAAARANAYAKTWEGIKESDPGRNENAVKHGAALTHDFDLTDEEAWPIMMGWNKKNTPPLPDAELAKCLTNGRKYGSNPVGCKLQDMTAGPYRETDYGLVWDKPHKDGPIETLLANFTAHIVSQVVYDDGLEQTRSLRIEANLGGRVISSVIESLHFGGMQWVMEKMGPQAIVQPGFGLKDRLRAAIQMLSRNIANRRVYTHTGWRKIDDEWVYLHTGGAIGPNGPVPEIDVELPVSLAPFDLSSLSQGPAVRDAIRASLGLLELGPDRVTVPVLAAVYRAPLGPCDHSVHLAGPTGVFKTELAALAQRHYGSGFDGRNLPGTWSSTANANESLAFTAKDAILVIDDFSPSGTNADVGRLHRDADRLLRGQGNQSGRLRLRADTSIRPSRFPRGLILSTGEDIPRGQSLGARMLIVEIGPGDIDKSALTRSQGDGAAGTFAVAMGAYVRWLAPKYTDVHHQLPAELVSLRDQIRLQDQHARTPSTVASLALGIRYFLDFAVAMKAVTRTDRNQLWDRCLNALVEVGKTQEAHLKASEPAARFLELVRSALSAGKAHLDDLSGGRPLQKLEPRFGAACGWQKSSGEWYSMGNRIGWTDGDSVFLDRTSAFRAAQDMAIHGDGLRVSERTLTKRLHQRELLASVDETRNKLLVRRTLDQSRREVIHLRREDILPRAEAQPAQSSRAPEPDAAKADSGAGQRAVPEADTAEPAQQNGPSRGKKERFGPKGPIGPLQRQEIDELMARAEETYSAAEVRRRRGHNHPRGRKRS